MEEGAVGAGKGMICFGYKGGIGSSSRIVTGAENQSYTVGCLVLSNFGESVEFRREQYTTETNVKRIPLLNRQMVQSS